MAQTTRPRPALSPQQRRTRDRAVLGIYIVRQVFGVSVLSWIVVTAFQAEATALAWPTLLATVGYFVFSSVVTWRAVQEYKKRYGGLS